MKIQILYSPECGNVAPVHNQIMAILAENKIEAELEILKVLSDEEARRHQFPGSPTIRVEGSDVEPGRQAAGDGIGLYCRLYVEGDQYQRWPSNRLMIDSIEMAHLVEEGVFLGCC